MTDFLPYFHGRFIWSYLAFSLSVLSVSKNLVYKIIYNKWLLFLNWTLYCLTVTRLSGEALVLFLSLTENSFYSFLDFCLALAGLNYFTSIMVEHKLIIFGLSICCWLLKYYIAYRTSYVGCIVIYYNTTILDYFLFIQFFRSSSVTI